MDVRNLNPILYVFLLFLLALLSNLTTGCANKTMAKNCNPTVVSCVADEKCIDNYFICDSMGPFE